MKPTSSLAITVALACASLAAQEPAPAPKPTPVPATQKPERKPLALGERPAGMIALPDIDGTVHRSADFAEQIVVVCFWSTECPIMRAYEKRMTAVVTEYREKGVRFLMINSNESNREIADGPARGDDGKPLPREADAPKPYGKIRNYLADHELPYTVLIDHGSVVADAFRAKTTPDVYVFGKDGVLVYRGAIDDDAQGRKGDESTPYLRNVLDKLVAGETVEPSQTEPVGCTIKRPRAAGARRSRG